MLSPVGFRNQTLGAEFLCPPGRWHEGRGTQRSRRERFPEVTKREVPRGHEERVTQRSRRERYLELMKGKVPRGQAGRSALALGDVRTRCQRLEGNEEGATS